MVSRSESLLLMVVTLFLVITAVLVLRLFVLEPIFTNFYRG